MNIKKYCIIIFLLIGCLFVSYIKGQDRDLDKKANGILLNARRSIGKSGESLNLQKISLVFNIARISKAWIQEINRRIEGQENGEKEIHSWFPDKFRYLELLNNVDSTFINKYILDSNWLEAERYGISEGKRIEFQIRGQETLTAEQKRQEIRDKKEEIFFTLFPILLESSSFFPVELKYIGKAELGGEKANVLEAILDKESKIRLFFDEETHLLKLLITEREFQDGLKIEERRFYTDYKNTDGLMIANKVNIEFKQSSGKSVVEKFEEQTLKSVKINPNFKSNFFEVKKK